VVAGELAERGRDVLLLEAGPHLSAADFTRWEAKATHDLFWPIRFAHLADGEVIAFLAGRCVGGTTTINTKVALRAHDKDVAKWHKATGLTNERGEPFSVSDLAPYYERVEQRLGVRERSDWQKCVRTVDAGMRRLGYELEPVTSYTDGNCRHCGSCMQGCPTNAGKSTGNTYIADTWARGLLELRAECAVDRVLVEGGKAVGVEYTDTAGGRQTVRADTVVVAGGALNTPQILGRSGLDAPAIGRYLGLHPVRLVYGLFDEPQDAHMTYPISSHCKAFQHDEDGGFVIEAATIQDPISFATTICDDDGPMWGPRLADAVRGFRHWVGVLALVNDENNGAVVVDENGGERFDVDFGEREQKRIEDSFEISRRVLEAAGATKLCWTGLASTHVQGSCRMGDDPERSAVDRNGRVHGVEGLYVGDASLIPRTLSVNPSLTIMSLATRLADHLA
jgi:choline dehydrogenase-like flavoprotein